MTKFNPENKETLTYGECLDPAMKITSKKDAKQYFSAYVEFTKKYIKGIESAEEICKSNLGYYAGYYDNETRKRVERLFNCCHPVFGSIEKNGIPTPKEAFELGKTGKKFKQV